MVAHEKSLGVYVARASFHKELLGVDLTTMDVHEKSLDVHVVQMNAEEMSLNAQRLRPSEVVAHHHLAGGLLSRYCGFSCTIAARSGEANAEIVISILCTSLPSFGRFADTFVIVEICSPCFARN